MAERGGKGILYAGAGLALLGVGIGVGAGSVGYLAGEKNATPQSTEETKTLSVSSREMHPVRREIFYEEKVVIIEEGEHQRGRGAPILGPLIPQNPLTDSKSIAIGTTTCEAGIDHQKFEPQYKVDGKSVTSTLGRAEVLGCKDPEIRFVGETGLFSAPDALRNQILDKIRERVIQQAKNDRLDDKAQQEAGDQEEIKLRRLGFEVVTVSFNNDTKEITVQKPTASPVPKR